jgi:hypothetical protein
MSQPPGGDWHGKEAASLASGHEHFQGNQEQAKGLRRQDQVSP